MPAHVTEVSCHLSGLRHSYNYMCSGTYYLIIGALRLPTLRYSLISLFPLPYKHVWTLSYTYRVLISPIDESSEQWNNKAKPKHSNFPCCEQWLCCGEPEDGQILNSATPWHGPPLQRGVSMPWRRTPTACPYFHDFTHFSINPTKNQRKVIYFAKKNIS